MNILLIFFAFPIAIIIFSIILEQLLRNPLAVGSIIFAIFLIVTFTAFDATFLIATLAYTILAFITAMIVHILKDRRNNNICNILSNLISNNEKNNNNNDNMCNAVESLITSNNSNNNDLNDSNTCGCNNRYRKRF